MSEQPLTLALLLDTVEQALSTRLTEIGAFLRGPLKQAPATLPALALEYAGLLPGRDPGNGQTALVCRLQARILVARDDAQAEAFALRNVAALAMLLRAQNWGAGTRAGQLHPGPAGQRKSCAGDVPGVAGRVAATGIAR